MRSGNKQLISVGMLIFLIVLITGCTFLSNSEVSDESTLIINESGSYTLSDNYEVVEIEVGDVVIEDGNAEKIVIEQTVGDGEVTLKNINAQKLYVFGGGVNSVLLQEKTRINEMQVKREDGQVRVAIEDESIVNNVTVAQGSQNVIIQGDIEILKVEASDVEVSADKGYIKKAIIENSNSSIIVGEDSKLDEGNISEGASGSKFVILGSGELIEVSGKENKVEVNGFLKKLIVTQKTDIVVNSNIDEVIFKDDAEESVLIINAEGVVKLIRSNTKININGTGYVEKAVAIATKQVAGNSVIKTIKLQNDPFVDMNDLKEENLETITNNVPKVDDNKQEAQDKEIYKIKFIDFDGTLLKAMDIEKNGSAVAPKDPSRIGYIFKGWDKAFDNVTQDMDVFAYYKANEYIIAFNENGGSKIEDIKGEFGKTISMPEDPNKEGYIVEGWYKNSALTDKWNFGKDTVPLNGLTLYAKWIVEDYSINYELNGGKNHFDAPTSYNIESEAISFKTPEKEGYMFVGWFDKKEGGNLFNEIAKGSVGDKVAYARWQAKSDTAYKIEHYKQNADGEGYSLVETENYQGVTDSGVESKAKSYDGFELNVNADGTLTRGTIKGDGSLTMKLYYDRIQYNVVFKDYDDSILKSEMVMYESDAKPPKAERLGYTFIGWSGTFDNVKSDITIKAVYEVNTDTAYKVEHYKQDVDGAGYTLSETQDLTGTTDTVATAEDKTYIGFTFDKDIEGTVQSGNVEGDGSLVLKLYYDRNEYSVVFKDHDGTVLKTESVLYEGDASAPVAARTGYVFDGWDGMYEYITSSRTLTATYKPGTDTAYKVEHYKQDVDGAGYTLAETQDLTGTTDTVATAEDKTYVGFTFDKDIEGTVQSGNVEGDGSLVLKLYYDRNEYQINFETGSGSLVETVSGVFGGLLLKPDDPTNEGHVFEGWYKEELLENKWDFNVDTIPASDITLFANWIKPSPNGTLLDAAAGSDFIGVLFLKSDGNIYYSKSDKNSSWQQEVAMGLGTEGSIEVDASDNVHVAYVTDGKIAYTKFDGNSWSEKTYIESLNVGGVGACSKVDLAVDGNLSPHITYTDSRGTSDDYSYPDIMYAKLSEGAFSRTVIFKGYRDYSSSGSWGADYFSGGSSIAVNENGDYFIIAHRQNIWRWFAGTDNTYYVMIHSNLGTGSISNYGTNIYATYDLTYSNGKFVALYKDSTFKTSEIAVSGGTAGFVNTTGIGGFSVTSVSNNGVSTVVGGKSTEGTLLTHLDGLSQDHMINVKDNKVSVVYLDGEYYGVYRDNESSELKIKKL